MNNLALLVGRLVKSPLSRGGGGRCPGCWSLAAGRVGCDCPACPRTHDCPWPVCLTLPWGRWCCAHCNCLLQDRIGC
ncbi:hypothetical protein B0T26DRAFT_729869 [Lasiosphaeria miniovina]|uniref:Uncharacterized protein n=1 Tax=Lasiosphaeria miniovina TaxID=1954250 RepID=A0AA39ZT89_9PEZI|nr:uncharacterized protein B0T26DRAFT_729869 [Lasiosphaeria miniovina]KAK0703118.1 hypothetical protein B0T26DRAFT_729869 [Lasiosphaeria miniovina]